MTDTEPINVTTAGESIDLLITGAPDVKNRYGSGTIRPSQVTLTYRDSSIHAQVYGRWRRESGELTDAPASQNYRSYKGDMDGWPEWLASMARERRPAATPAADRAVLRDRIAEALEGVRVWRTVDGCDGWEYAGTEALADALAAVLPEPTDRAAVLLEAADELEADYRPESGYDRGRAWCVEELRRLADEAQQPETPSESCVHCGKSIRLITGTLAEWWVHDPGGIAACHPAAAASSTRATPKAAAEAQQPDTGETGVGA